MPLLTTTTLAVLYPFLIELAKKGADKIVETSSEKLTSGSISWLKSLFFKDDEPKKELKELMNLKMWKNKLPLRHWLKILLRIILNMKAI